MASTCSTLPSSGATSTGGVCSTCAFCERGNEDPEVIGELWRKGSLVVHKFCLYFSSGLDQRGSESEGIHGFLVSDIREELLRGRKKKGYLQCWGCGKKDFFVGCAIKKCSRAGHFPCLLEAGFLFQYFGTYKAYCPTHRPKQTIHPHRPLSTRSLSASCCICLTSDMIKTAPSFQVLVCPCCFNPFHRTCVQHQARSAGLHFFRCPVCNDKKMFVEEMLRMGIEVPDRDAAWESTDDDYYDYTPDYTCRTKVCVCHEGRNHFSSTYVAVRCHYCSQCIGHEVCVKNSGKPVNKEGELVCDDCAPALTRLQPQSNKAIKAPPTSSAVVEDCVVIDSSDDDDDDVILIGEEKGKTTPQNNGKESESSEEDEFVFYRVRCRRRKLAWLQHSARLKNHSSACS